jgi:hypothetical protein
LKDTVNGHIVGGYDSADVPQPYVLSNEQGYPVSTAVTAARRGGGVVTADGNANNGGWEKHEAGAAQMALYRPNYTDTVGTPILHTVASIADASNAGSYKSISVWCSACHEKYNQYSAASAVSYNYDPNLPANGAANQAGTQNYHRHAIDTNMAAGLSGSGILTVPVISDARWVPLENASTGSGSFDQNFIGCLTCHRAHGSSSAMTGYAASHLELQSVNVTGTVQSVYMPVRDTIAGVDPDKGVYNGTANQGSSALLRANNRGVCERCHNK